jgi:hypothetical protein
MLLVWPKYSAPQFVRANEEVMQLSLRQLDSAELVEQVWLRPAALIDLDLYLIVEVID